MPRAACMAGCSTAGQGKWQEEQFPLGATGIALPQHTQEGNVLGWAQEW